MDARCAAPGVANREVVSHAMPSDRNFAASMRASASAAAALLAALMLARAALAAPGSSAASAGRQAAARQANPAAVWGGYRFRLGGRVVAISPEGDGALTGDGEGVLRLWNLRTGEQTRLLREPRELLRCAVIAPGGRLAASGSSSGTITVWNLESAAPRRLPGRHRGEVLSLAFLDGGALLASGGEDGAVRIWRVEDGKILRTLRGHRGWVKGLAELAGRRLVSADDRGTILSWNLDARGGAFQALANPKGEGEPGIRLLAAEGAQVLAADEDGGVRFFGLDDGLRVQLPVPAGRVVALAFAMGQARVAAVTPGEQGSGELWLGVWQRGASGVSTSFRRPDDGTASAALSPDGTALLVDDSRGLRLLNGTDGAVSRATAGHAAEITGIAVAADGSLAVSSSRDGTARAWRVEDGRELYVLRGFVPEVKAATISADGALLLVGDVAGRQLLADARTGAELRVLGPHRGLQALGFAADGKTSFSASYERMARWNIESGAEAASSWLGRVASGAAFSVDGERVLVAGGGEVQLRSTSTGQVLAKLARRAVRLDAVALSTDNSLAAIAQASSGGHAAIELWRPADGRATRIVGLATAAITALGFSGDGSLLAAASSDGEVRVWRVDGGELQLEASLKGNAERPTALAFLPSGRGLLVGTSLGAVLRYAIAPTLEPRADQQAEP